MKNFFNQSDVLEFLAQHDYGLWTHNLIGNTGKSHSAKDEDFENNIINTFEMLDTYDERSFKDFAITNFRFAEVKYSSNSKECKNERLLTLDWCKFLLEEYGVEYADALKDWCENCLSELSNYAKEKGANLSPEQKNKIEKAANYYNQLLTLAKTKIQDYENENGLSA